MFTVIGWNDVNEVINAYTKLVGAHDQHVKVVDTKIYVPPLNKLVFAAAKGVRLYRGRFESPSLRRLAYLEIDPNDNNAAEGYPCGRIMYQGLSPLTLVEGEGLEASSFIDAADATAHTIIAGLADAPLLPVTGEIWCLRATAELTTIEGRWVNSEITFDVTLPVGRYQIVGASVYAHNTHAFRFVPIGSMWRPGGITMRGGQLDAPPMFRKGGMGVWCEFDSLTPPSIELLAQDEAPKTTIMHIDVIKVA